MKLFMHFLPLHKKKRRPDPARVLRRFMRLLERRLAPQAPALRGGAPFAGFAHRVRMLAHISRRSPASVVYSVGLRGEAAAQVLAALEAE